MIDECTESGVRIVLDTEKKGFRRFLYSDGSLSESFHSLESARKVIEFDKKKLTELDIGLLVEELDQIPLFCSHCG
ncbi:MAG: hypothetical protein UY07_C0022G0029 [Parcubacteria group bacterium GW2011_GWA1_47_8]|nr:MAG: hypothetical protein UY07_C0022G0029 [Parcubacteria group bacterium GW2011_GWA1_47_8]KKW07886.1 MAG: hypothetical protein UY42_C0004G0028 [Parcubacteria group bacterium GW2011_GWA2_49_16]